MRKAWMIGLAAAALAGAASAAELRIEYAAARVVVIPEARNDVQVTVTPGAARVPRLDVSRRGGTVVVNGNLRNRIDNCGGGWNLFGGGDQGGQRDAGTVHIDGVGRVRVADLPLITARVPLNADVGARGAIWGQVGRSQSLTLAASGCGDWSVADVAGPATLAISGSGDLRGGDAGQALVRVSGSGDVRLGRISGPLQAQISGSGDVRAVSARERVTAAIAGSGDVVVEGGRFRTVEARIAGSGDLRVGGVTEDVDAAIAGSGDVRVGQVTGRVSRRVAGSGDVIVGR